MRNRRPSLFTGYENPTLARVTSNKSGGDTSLIDA